MNGTATTCIPPRRAKRVFPPYFINGRATSDGDHLAALDIHAVAPSETWEDSPEGYPRPRPYKCGTGTTTTTSRPRLTRSGVEVSRRWRSRLPKARRRGESELKKGRPLRRLRAAGSFHTGAARVYPQGARSIARRRSWRTLISGKGRESRRPRELLEPAVARPNPGSPRDHQRNSSEM